MVKKCIKGKVVEHRQSLSMPEKIQICLEINELGYEEVSKNTGIDKQALQRIEEEVMRCS